MGFNPLWPDNAIWCHRSGSTLAQVMVFCLMVPSHYLNQCSIHEKGPVIFIWGQFHKRYLSHQSLKLAWKNFTKIWFRSPRGQWVNQVLNCVIPHRYKKGWVNSLWLGGVIWHLGFCPTLVRVMAWCRQAASHNLIQYRHFITKVHRNLFCLMKLNKFHLKFNIIIQVKILDIVWKTSAILFQPQCDKMAAIFQTTFSNAFSWMKMYEFRLRFHWSLFPRVQLTIFQHLFREWLGAYQATSHCLNQWWLIYWCMYVSPGFSELNILHVISFMTCQLEFFENGS